MTVVALTGGIASGKSTVSTLLESRGIRVVDADILARNAVAPGSPGLDAVVDRFGSGVLTPSGELDRTALGAIVFADPAARHDLNGILHPEIGRLSREQLAEHSHTHPETPLVYAVPLLAETGRQGEFDLVVVVDAPAEARQKRLIDFRGLEPEEAQRRVAAQATDDARREIADVLVDSSRDEATTKKAADELADWLWATWPDRLREIPRRLPSVEGYTRESGTDT